MRIRQKLCNKCKKYNDTLYRCRVDNLKLWHFVCEKCLPSVKSEHPDTYQYGGTWKGKK